MTISQTDKQASHTPLPWTNEPGRFWVCGVGNNGDDPAIWSAFPVKDNTPFPFGSKEADAAFIVRAVNSHHQLVALAQGIVGIAKDGTWEEDTEWLVERARAALKLAEESE